ncbi:MAG: Panacea domain-containing protein, partial [Thermodesulfobacteriota bacterium]
MKKNKLSQLIIYIATKSKDDPNFGVTKLNKILFTIDFYAYGLRGESISEAKYIHLKKGPAPKDMRTVLNGLQKDGKIKIDIREYFGYEQKRIIALKNPDLSLFATDELEFTDYLIDQTREFTAKSLSTWTHT